MTLWDRSGAQAQALAVGVLCLLIRIAIDLPLPVGAARLQHPVAALGTGLVERDPARARSWGLLGTSLGRQGQHQGALDAFRHALELDPENVHARRGIALARSGVGVDGVAGVSPRDPGG